MLLAVLLTTASGDLCTAADHHPPFHYSYDWGGVAARAKFHAAAARLLPQAKIGTLGR